MTADIRSSADLIARTARLPITCQAALLVVLNAMVNDPGSDRTASLIADPFLAYGLPEYLDNLAWLQQEAMS